MEMELGCLVALNRPADLKELSADITTRFPDFPLAKLAAEELSKGSLPKVKPVKQPSKKD